MENIVDHWVLIWVVVFAIAAELVWTVLQRRLLRPDRLASSGRVLRFSSAVDGWISSSANRAFARSSFLFIALTLTIAVPLFSWVSYFESGREVANLQARAELCSNEVNSLEHQLEKCRDSVFAAFQTAKLRSLYMFSSTQSDSAIQSEQNKIHIQRCRMFSFVSPSFTCTRIVYNVSVPEGGIFEDFSLFAKEQHPEDSFVVQLGHYIEPDSVYWEVLTDTTYIEPYGNRAILSLELPAAESLLIQIDGHKKGWSTSWPISLLGIDTKNYAYPPSQFELWALFASEPERIEAWVFDIDEVSKLSDAKLARAILHQDTLMFYKELSPTADFPQWDDVRWWTSSERLRSRFPLRYSVVLPAKKRFLALSFWQSTLDTAGSKAARLDGAPVVHAAMQ